MTEEHAELIALLEALHEIRDLLKEGIDLKRRQLGIALEADAEDATPSGEITMEPEGHMFCEACKGWRSPSHFKYYGIHQPRREIE